MNISFVLLCLAVVATVAFVLKVSIPIDSGAEISGDFTNISDTDTSFSLFTIEGILAFFMCFGWVGWIAKQFLNYPTRKVLILAVILGAAAMLFYGWMISKIKKLEHVPNATKEELINKAGKAYMHFPPKGQAKIEIEYNSKLEILDAINNSDIEIQSFEAIKVVKVENDNIYIEKL